jgi:hypothetical protein
MYTSHSEIHFGELFLAKEEGFGCDLLILSCLDVIRSVNEETVGFSFIFEGCHVVLFLLMIAQYTS